jgi:hypothetical protein
MILTNGVLDPAKLATAVGTWSVGSFINSDAAGG